MKIYKTGGWKELIEEVEVEKVNDKSVWFKDGRCSKRSVYANYWNTIEEAKQHLKEKYNRIIDVSKKKIEVAKADLEKLNKY